MTGRRSPRVAKPYGLARINGRLTLVEIRSIAGGGMPWGAVAGYRVLPLTDEGVYLNGPVAPDAPGDWLGPGSILKDWAIRPSEANLEKARERARQDMFA